MKLDGSSEAFYVIIDRHGPIEKRVPKRYKGQYYETILWVHWWHLDSKFTVIREEFHSIKCLANDGILPVCTSYRAALRLKKRAFSHIYNWKRRYKIIKVKLQEV